MCHRTGTPMYQQDQRQLSEDLRGCYTPSQLFGLAIHFRVFSKRYYKHGDDLKARYYFNLYRRIISWDVVQDYINRNSKQLVFSFILEESTN